MNKSVNWKKILIDEVKSLSPGTRVRNSCLNFVFWEVCVRIRVYHIFLIRLLIFFTLCRHHQQVSTVSINNSKVIHRPGPDP